MRVVAVIVAGDEKHLLLAPVGHQFGHGRQFLVAAFGMDLAHEQIGVQHPRPEHLEIPVLGQALLEHPAMGRVLDLENHRELVPHGHVSLRPVATGHFPWNSTRRGAFLSSLRGLAVS